jgi:hypothetical protein
MDRDTQYKANQGALRTIVALLVVSMIGCTSMQRVDKDPASLAQTLAPGDEIRVVDMQGHSTDLIFTSIENGKLKGNLAQTPDVIVQTSLTEIDSIERRQPSAVRSLLTGATVIYAVIVFMAIRSL